MFRFQKVSIAVRSGEIREITPEERAAAVSETGYLYPSWLELDGVFTAETAHAYFEEENTSACGINHDEVKVFDKAFSLRGFRTCEACNDEVEERTQPSWWQRVFLLLAYYSVIVLYYISAICLAYGIARWLWLPLAVPLLIVGFVAMCAVTVYYVVFVAEEDWWNDFKAQNRAGVLGLMSNIASIGGGAWLGFSA